MRLNRFQLSALTLYLIAESAMAFPPPQAEETRSPPRQVSGSVVAPNLLFAPAPTYTPRAKAAKIQGNVVVEALVDEQGSVSSVELVKGLALGLSAQAMSTVRTWRFEPATLADAAIPVTIEIVVDFRLSGMMGLVHDPEAGLTWTEKDNGSAIDLASAHHYCERLKTSPSAAWRVPTLEELEDLFDESRARFDDCTPKRAKIERSANSRCFSRIEIDFSAPLVVSATEDTGNTATSLLFAFDSGSRQERLSSHAGELQRALCVTSQRP